MSRRIDDFRFLCGNNHLHGRVDGCAVDGEAQVGGADIRAVNGEFSLAAAVRYRACF